MKIYTKTGDTGDTSLFSGRRVSKADALVEAYGTVDELNAFVGQLRDQVEVPGIREGLSRIQRTLFALGASLADDREGESYAVPERAAPAIEEAMDAMNEDLPAMTHFILPGGHPAVSAAHVCRTVCRRAERRVVLAAEDTAVDPSVIVYLNRLSDYFFVLARYLGQTSGVEEIKWEST